MDACQTDHQNPRSFGSNQFVIIFTHGGAASPWKQPFNNQKRANCGSVELKPKAMFSKLHMKSPRAKTRLGLIKSPSRPPRNREEPYAKGKSDWSFPISAKPFQPGLSQDRGCVTQALPREITDGVAEEASPESEPLGPNKLCVCGSWLWLFGRPTPQMQATWPRKPLGLAENMPCYNCLPLTGH